MLQGHAFVSVAMPNSDSVTLLCQIQSVQAADLEMQYFKNEEDPDHFAHQGLIFQKRS